MYHVAMKRHRLINKRFGRLLVVKLSNKQDKDNRKLWGCHCDCGNEVFISSYRLTSKNTRSCGCFRKDFLKQSKTIHGFTSYKKVIGKEYNSWAAMIQRCNNPNNISYKNYGAKGIKVCKRWEKFENFIKDMGKKPSINHSIDRIDIRKGYSPNNCRWATRSEQANNTSRNRFITYNGTTMTLKQWSHKLGISQTTLAERLQKWSIEKALTTYKLR